MYFGFSGDATPVRADARGRASSPSFETRDALRRRARGARRSRGRFRETRRVPGEPLGTPSQVPGRPDVPAAPAAVAPVSVHLRLLDFRDVRPAERNTARRLFVARREDGTRAVCPTPQKGIRNAVFASAGESRHKGTSSCRSQTWRSARPCSRCASSSRGPRSSSSRRRLPTCSCRSAIRSSIRRRSSGGRSWRSRSSRRVASSSARPSTTRTAREDPRVHVGSFSVSSVAELAKTVPPGGKRRRTPRACPPMIFA